MAYTRIQRSLSPQLFEELAKKGLNCKQIAKEMGYHSHRFGLKMKNVLGIYPSVHIARMKNGKT